MKLRTLAAAGSLAIHLVRDLIAVATILFVALFVLGLVGRIICG